MKREEFEMLVNELGRMTVSFDRPIRFKSTPHSPIKWIWSVSIDDDLEEYGEAIMSVKQTLRWMKHLKDADTKD